MVDWPDPLTVIYGPRPEDGLRNVAPCSADAEWLDAAAAEVQLIASPGDGQHRMQRGPNEG